MESKRKTLRVFGAGAFASILTIFVIYGANKYLGLGPPLLWFVPSIIVTSYLGGFVPGVISTAVAAAASDFLFLQPNYSFYISSNNDRIRLLVFTGIGLTLSYFMESLHSLRRRALLALEVKRRKESELRHILSAVPAAILFVDSNLNYRFCNDTFASWLGLSSNDMIGQPVKEIVPSEYYGRMASYYSEVLKGKRVSFDEYLEFKDKSRFVHVEMIPESEESGEILGCIVLKYDISDRVKMENSLEQAKKAADSANRAKSTFLASMSHEIRTPLSVILGYADLLEIEKLSELSLSFVNRIRHSGQILLSLINDILDLAKVESGQIQIEYKIVEIKPFFLEIRNQFKALADKRGISLDIVISEKVSGLVVTDEARFRQIITNLIGNAIKFTARGEVKLAVNQLAGVKPGPDDCESTLKVSVSDTGKGIAPENWKKIFEPFVQAEDYVNRVHGGTGLGLNLARNLARLLGGELWLESSAIEKGSTFSVTIPVKEIGGSNMRPVSDSLTPEDCETKSSVTAPKTGGIGRLVGKKILLVEDIFDNQVMIKEILTRYGASVDIAVDGEQGCARALAGHYDLLLMDIQMPVLNGYMAVSKLRDMGYNGPIIAITAEAMKGEAEKCRAAGFSDYVAKPFEIGHLISVAQFHTEGA